LVKAIERRRGSPAIDQLGDGLAAFGIEAAAVAVAGRDIADAASVCTPASGPPCSVPSLHCEKRLRGAVVGALPALTGALVTTASISA